MIRIEKTRGIQHGVPVEVVMIHASHLDMDIYIPLLDVATLESSSQETEKGKEFVDALKRQGYYIDHLYPKNR
ncbi:MAG: hypothetical protein M1610_03835 [Nitrospirae bacterium]|jgi:hypothetical protein|nr:hypothetical protein [Nitrospirota bacterium]MDA8337976.1 hypothetical protein [Nitrospiraceae bacterium]